MLSPSLSAGGENFFYDTTYLIVPHVTPQLGWWRTYLTLVNPGDRINSVNFHLAVAGTDPANDMDLNLGAGGPINEDEFIDDEHISDQEFLQNL